MSQASPGPRGTFSPCLRSKQRTEENPPQEESPMPSLFRHSRILVVPLFLLSLLVAVAATAAEPASPTTPAGKAFAAWLAAFNAADAARLRRFDAAYPREGPTPPVEDRLRFREATGGFTLVRIEKSEPLSLVALLQEKSSDTMVRMEMVLSAGEPRKLLRSML